MRDPTIDLTHDNATLLDWPALLEQSHPTLLAPEADHHRNRQYLTKLLNDYLSVQTEIERLQALPKSRDRAVKAQRDEALNQQATIRRRVIDDIDAFWDVQALAHVLAETIAIGSQAQLEDASTLSSEKKAGVLLDSLERRFTWTNTPPEHLMTQIFVTHAITAELLSHTQPNHQPSINVSGNLDHLPLQKRYAQLLQTCQYRLMWLAQHKMLDDAKPLETPAFNAGTWPLTSLNADAQHMLFGYLTIDDLKMLAAVSKGAVFSVRTYSLASTKPQASNQPQQPFSLLRLLPLLAITRQCARDASLRAHPESTLTGTLVTLYQETELSADVHAVLPTAKKWFQANREHLQADIKRFFNPNTPGALRHHQFLRWMDDAELPSFHGMEPNLPARLQLTLSMFGRWPDTPHLTTQQARDHLFTYLDSEEPDQLRSNLATALNPYHMFRFVRPTQATQSMIGRILVDYFLDPNHGAQRFSRFAWRGTHFRWASDRPQVFSPWMRSAIVAYALEGQHECMRMLELMQMLFGLVPNFIRQAYHATQLYEEYMGFMKAYQADFGGDRAERKAHPILKHFPDSIMFRLMSNGFMLSGLVLPAVIGLCAVEAASITAISGANFTQTFKSLAFGSISKSFSISLKAGWPHYILFKVISLILFIIAMRKAFRRIVFTLFGDPRRILKHYYRRQERALRASIDTLKTHPISAACLSQHTAERRLLTKPKDHPRLASHTEPDHLSPSDRT